MDSIKVILGRGMGYTVVEHDLDTPQLIVRRIHFPTEELKCGHKGDHAGKKE